MQDRETGSDRPALQPRRGRRIAWTVAVLSLAILSAALWEHRRAVLGYWRSFEPEPRENVDWEMIARMLVDEGYGRGPINGIVEAVHAVDKLVVLSVGKDQNVMPGYHFYVRRGADYIGKVKVIQVFDDLSGARIDFTLDGVEIQEGDQVSTWNRGN